MKSPQGPDSLATPVVVGPSRAFGTYLKLYYNHLLPKSKSSINNCVKLLVTVFQYISHSYKVYEVGVKILDALV